MNKVDLVEKSRLRDDVPDFRPGDTVKVHVKVIEGSRSRIQVFEGVVIRRQGGGLRETFTVRKVSFGVGVERTFPVHSPVIEQVELTRRGKVRRAKLYYLRDRVGQEGAHQGEARGRRQLTDVAACPGVPDVAPSSLVRRLRPPAIPAGAHGVRAPRPAGLLAAMGRGG